MKLGSPFAFCAPRGAVVLFCAVDMIVIETDGDASVRMWARSTGKRAGWNAGGGVEDDV